MDERFDARTPPPMERLGGPQLGGGAFRRIPIVPVVALVTFFLGLAVGSGLASKTQQVPSGGPSGSIVASTSASAASSGPTLDPSLGPTPPAGGITMGQAIVDAQGALDFDDSQVVSAILIRDLSEPNPPPERWIWEIAIEEPGRTPCWHQPQQMVPDPSFELPVPSGSLLVPAPAASPTAQLCTNQSATIGVDYLTGLVVSAEWGGTVVP